MDVFLCNKTYHYVFYSTYKRKDKAFSISSFLLSIKIVCLCMYQGTEKISLFLFIEVVVVFSIDKHKHGELIF